MGLQPLTSPVPPDSSPVPLLAGALKKAKAKAKKEAEKARRAAEQQAKQAAAKAAAGNTEGLAMDNYGDDHHTIKVEAERVALKDIGNDHLGKTIKVRAWIQNSRMQGAKMAFVELREERKQAIQGVVAASAEGKPVSKQMVKWIGALNLESYVLVEAKVEKPLEPAKSIRVSDYELHITKCYCTAADPEVLGMGLAVSDKAVTNLDDEYASDAKEIAEGVENLSVDNVPGASMATHLNNPVMHKRAPVQQVIADVRMTVRKLFSEYLEARKFVQFEASCLINAASEGGSNAYLAQSPQVYKQIEIAGGRKRVFCIGPVFRAENSNTPRHMTEDDYHEVMHMLECVLLYIFRGTQERCAEQVALVRTVYHSEEFLLPEAGKEVRPEEYRNVSDDEDISTPQEKALGALVREKYNTDFYVLDKFPESARSFYAMEDPNPRRFSLIHVPDVLEARIRKKDVDPASPGIKYYVDIFRSAGVPPHGGDGIGLDRVVAWYLNLPSVHLASYYLRTPKRLLP
ncbi:hypothetical protein B0T10DRAFT_574075 [Thelonectria olida]|uniref:aspartate--tRNA ligase n=1 Tax=Thelonectria olida TaxID=1576542 RepID=A0A9P9ANH4_9HYPO|nr:hypothetical protein B0T10DRAFT_574075 [Thelonectria olida]